MEIVADSRRHLRQWRSWTSPARLRPRPGFSTAADPRTRTALLGDPVATLLRSVRRASHVVEHAARPLDHDSRRGVVVVARHENQVDSLRTCDHERLAEDLRRVTTTTAARAHAISDVASEVRQEGIQLVTYRDAADELRAHISDQERRGT